MPVFSLVGAVRISVMLPTLLLSPLLSGCGGLRYSVDAVNFGTQGVILRTFAGFKATTLGVVEGKNRYGDPYRYDYRVPGLEGIPMVGYLTTVTPTLMDSPASPMGRFPDHPDSLPDHVEVEWQLAALSDCTHVHTIERPEQTERYQFMLDDLRVRPRKPEDEARLLKAALARSTWSQLVARGHENPGKYIRQRDCTWAPIEGAVYREVVDLKAVRESEAYRRTGKRNPSVALSKFVLRLTFVFENDQLEVQAESYTTNPWS